MVVELHESYLDNHVAQNAIQHGLTRAFPESTHNSVTPGRLTTDD